MPAPTDPDARDALRRELVDAETVRVLARRGRTLIVPSKLGIVQAAAGVDGSNVRARRARAAARRPGRQRRPAAGRPAPAARRRRRCGGHRHDGPHLAGRPDRRRDRLGRADRAAPLRGHGRRRRATSCWSPRSRVADELAAAADLVKGKLGGLPVAVVRGLRPVDDGLDRARPGPPARRGPVLARHRRGASPQGRREAVLLRRSTRRLRRRAGRRRRRCAERWASRSPRPRRTTARRSGSAGCATAAGAPRCWTRWPRAGASDLEATGGRPRGRAPDAARRPAAPAPELVLAFRTGDGMHDYRDDARRRRRAHDVHRRRRRGRAVAPGRAGRRGPRLVLGRVHDLRRRTWCAAVLELPADWQPLGAVAVGVPAEPLRPAPAARPGKGCVEW